MCCSGTPTYVLGRSLSLATNHRNSTTRLSADLLRTVGVDHFCPLQTPKVGTTCYGGRNKCCNF